LETKGSTWRKEGDTIATTGVRPVNTLTAMGHWCHVLVAPRYVTTSLYRNAVGLVADLKPAWKPLDQKVDLFAWAFGARVLARSPELGKYPERRRLAWLDTLGKVLKDHASADGSWEPLGTWGPYGGRVYSTAVGVTALLGSIHSPRIELPRRDKVRHAILTAAKSDDPEIAEAAARALPDEGR